MILCYRRRQIYDGNHPDVRYFFSLLLFFRFLAPWTFIALLARLENYFLICAILTENTCPLFAPHSAWGKIAFSSIGIWHSFACFTCTPIIPSSSSPSSYACEILSPSKVVAPLCNRTRNWPCRWTAYAVYTQYSTQPHFFLRRQHEKYGLNFFPSSSSTIPDKLCIVLFGIFEVIILNYFIIRYNVYRLLPGEEGRINN